VPSSSSILAELLPPGFGEWEPITGGESGASVVRALDAQRYAKMVPTERVEELAAERDRSVWLMGTEIPCARVLGWRETEAGACLITQAAPGVPASTLEAEALQLAWPSVVAAVRALHGLASDQCPFDRSLAWMMHLARAAVAEDRVTVEFLPEALQGTPPTLVLERIDAELTLRLAQERADLVVCHGDLCLPNVLVDPATDRFTAFIDLGRLGTADPYGDIALLLATARQTWSDEAMARRAGQEFAEIYGTAVDAEREDFYLRLDALTW
jgi:streptomycin 3"-kinase